ncbi:Protein F37A4.1 [Aphelenchoides avenae]|nr:Protein F37A4.1 [Aphelenchus avenae]
MDAWQRLKESLFGPRVNALYVRDTSYAANFFENLGDLMLTVAGGVKNFCLVTSPLLVPYLIRRLSVPQWQSTARYIIIYYAFAYALRTFGRLVNTTYQEFLELYVKAIQTDKPERAVLDQLRIYDYELNSAPADFVTKPRADKWYAPPIDEEVMRPLAEPWHFLRECAAYASAHTFGRRMLYPGALAAFKAMARGTLAQKRYKAVVEDGGQRNILQTEDNNRIDTLFKDRRLSAGNGSILAICCEGNAGYYEVGITVTPEPLGYSLLSWNMPGFGESTGDPYPDAILNAMEAVMQFAIQRLGFKPEEILLYGWSIGGFPACWAAANYPQIRGLIVDASFDDLIPLAKGRMPTVIEPIVHYAVRKYLDLPIARQLAQYKGPVLLIRRFYDDILITNDAGNPDEKRASNRANNLLLALLKSRHPGLLRDSAEEDAVRAWLALEPTERVMVCDCNDPLVPANLSALSAEDRTRLIQQLCNKYFVDFMGGHNVPLDGLYFNVPTAVQCAL